MKMECKLSCFDKDDTPIIKDRVYVRDDGSDTDFDYTDVIAALRLNPDVVRVVLDMKWVDETSH